MRKLVLLTFLGALLCLSQSLFAQYDANAKKILDQMSNTYQKMSAYQAKFVYQLKSVNDNEVEEEMQGQITVKGNQFRMKTDEQEVFNDGKNVWTYLKDDNEVTITDNEEDSEINPTKIYTMYKEGYKYLFVEEVKKDSKTYEVVDLIPEDKDLDYFKVRLFIHKGDKKLGSWTIFQKNGMHFTFQILEFKEDVKVTDKHFVFEKAKYPDVEEVDLREQ